MLEVRILFRTPASYYKPRESRISKGWHVLAYKNTLVEHLYMKPILDGRLFFTVLSFMEPNDDEVIRSLKVSAADVLAESSGSSQPHHGSLTSLRQRIRRTITSADDGRRDVRVWCVFAAQHFARFSDRPGRIKIFRPGSFPPSPATGHLIHCLNSLVLSAINIEGSKDNFTLRHVIVASKL